MQQDISKGSGGDAAGADGLSAAFEHSITWEDDLWRADPVDVEQVHIKARRKFFDLLEAITGARGGQAQARILLFHGQSGAGKTHLIRALRTGSHRQGKAYFGYAQMTPDVTGYADYFLRRLVNSLEKPYDPDQGGESGLTRLTTHLVADAEEIRKADLKVLRETSLDEAELAKLVLRLADEIANSPRFAGEEFDINIVRALLYLQRSDPRIDARVRQYLTGRPLTKLAHASVAALDPNSGDGRAFEIIEALGKLMWTVDRAALVVSIDQVEDLRFFADAEERFQKAVRDLIQIANLLPTSIVVISCLEDFYSQVRKVLAQSYIDRIEKSGPVLLLEGRSAEEAKAIIGKRLEQAAKRQGGLSFPDAAAFSARNSSRSSAVFPRADCWSMPKAAFAPRRPCRNRKTRSPRKRVAFSIGGGRWRLRWALQAVAAVRRSRMPTRPMSTTARSGNGSLPTRRPKSLPTTTI